MSKRMTTLEALEYGLANIRTYGWIQRDLGAEDRGFCALGALSGGAAGATPWPARDALTAHLPAATPSSSLVLWNNAEGRTQAEVEALYLRAIAAEPA